MLSSPISVGSERYLIIKALKRALSKQLGNFEHNAAQMHYADYRQEKYLVGSGIVEVGCRTVIGERLKQSGMHWSVCGTNTIIALRCCEPNISGAHLPEGIVYVPKPCQPGSLQKILREVFERQKC